MEKPVKGQLSVLPLLKHWYVACLSKDLDSAKPLGLTLFDIPLVIFRNASGEPAAMQDRCPHRNVPLSDGNVEGGELVCAYHGWQFNSAGERTLVPGLLEQGSHRCVLKTYHCLEQDGYIFVCPSAGFRPQKEPLRLPQVGAGYARYQMVIDMDCTVHAAMENALDVAHTAFLHGGLFRGLKARTDIVVELQGIDQGIEADYIGEPFLPGGRKPPKGVTPRHWDRFMLPSTVQVEYQAGKNNHVCNTLYHTPLSAIKTRMFFTGFMRLPGLGRFFKPLIAYNVRKVIQQDVDMLARQTETILRFGGEEFQSSQMDLLGPQLWRFMRHAQRYEKGEVDSPTPDFKPRSVTINL